MFSCSRTDVIPWITLSPMTHPTREREGIGNSGAWNVVAFNATAREGNETPVSRTRCASTFTFYGRQALVPPLILISDVTGTPNLPHPITSRTLFVFSRRTGDPQRDGQTTVSDFHRKGLYTHRMLEKLKKRRRHVPRSLPQ